MSLAGKGTHLLVESCLQAIGHFLVNIHFFSGKGTHLLVGVLLAGKGTHLLVKDSLVGKVSCLLTKCHVY